MKKCTKFLKVLFCFGALFTTTAVVHASTGSFSSTYHITHGTAGYGTLDTRTFNLATNNRSVTMTIRPNSGTQGVMSATLQRSGILGSWSNQSSRTFDTSRTRTFTGGSSGTHRFRMASTGNFTFVSSGGVDVSW